MKNYTRLGYFTDSSVRPISDDCHLCNFPSVTVEIFLTWPRSTGVGLDMDFRLATAFSERSPWLLADVSQILRDMS